jgi:O-antigen/teichoic acid export membrane protein
MPAGPHPSSTPSTPDLGQAGATDAAPLSSQAVESRRLVRNTFFLTAAQAVTVPISVVSNALIGRYLGSEDFGYLYLASTVCAFAILGLEWGLQGATPALVARDRRRAGAYLGTGLVWRGMSSLVVSLLLALVCWLLGYSTGARWAVALSFPLAVLNSVGSGFKDTIRGFERTDIPAYAHVAQQLMMVIVLVPVLMLGGLLRALLISQIAVAIVTVFYLRRSLRPVGVGALTYDRDALKALLSLGTPFVVFGLAMVLGPFINGAFLAKLVPPEVIGWYGVSQRLIGLLIFPATSIVNALYPTLCRLHTEDKSEFVRVTRGALYGVALIAIPAAVGCGMFPEIGVGIFGTAEFSGAAAHLRLMSLFVFLVYFSMPLGTAILASDRQKAWTVVQCICLVVSLAGNPFLIPYFQRRMGNGALGTCLTLVLSELLVVLCGMALVPRGLFDRGLGKSLLMASLAGVGMIAVAHFTKPISLFLAVPASLLIYVLVAWFGGAVQPATVEMLKGILGRRLGRFRRAPSV